MSAKYPPYSGIQLGDVAGGAAVATGWTRDPGPPAVVRLTTSTDQVAIGTNTPATGRKLTILTTGANQGVRVTTTVSTDNVIDTLVSGDPNTRFSILGDGSISWGSGGATQDVRLQRTGTKALAIDDGAFGDVTLSVIGTEAVTVTDAVTANPSVVLTLKHRTTGIPAAGIGARLVFQAQNDASTAVDAAYVSGRLLVVTSGTEDGVLDFSTKSAGTIATRWRMVAAGSLVPQTDNALTVGTSTLRVATVNASTAHRVYTASADAQPSGELSAGAVKFGPGGATAPDVRLNRSTTKTITLDDGAAGSAALIVLGSTTTQARVVRTMFNLAAGGAYTVGALDDFVGMDTTTGAQAILLPAAVTGRRLVCKNTALVAVVNLANVTPNGAETIDGVAAAVGLTGTQKVTLVGRTGVGWYTA